MEKYNYKKAIKILNTTNHEIDDEQIADMFFGNVDILDLRVDNDLNYLANLLLVAARKFEVVILPLGNPAFMSKFAAKTRKSGHYVLVG